MSLLTPFQGETVPADCLLFKINEDVTCDQSALTGESQAVHKFWGDVIYYTTGVESGDATGIVVGTTLQTFVGRTASLIGVVSKERGRSTRTEDLPYFLTEYLRVTRAIAGSTCALASLALCLAWMLPIFTGSHQIIELALGLAIALAPTGREIAIVGVRATGAARLTQGRAVVQAMANSEALAGIDILCSDKTGTLTANPVVHTRAVLCWMYPGRYYARRMFKSPGRRSKL